MLCYFALFNDNIIDTWPSLHYMHLGIVDPVGTDGRPPVEEREGETREGGIQLYFLQKDI